MLVGSIDLALAIYLNGAVDRDIASTRRTAPLETVMVVVPYRPYEICLLKSSVHRGDDGLTYFNTTACDPQRTAPVEEYRLNCAQDADGPISYEHKIEGQWIPSTAHGFDEIDQIIRGVCGHPTGLPRKPPRPPV